MNARSWMLLFLCSFLITSCQVKKSSGSGGLIAGHVPTTNSFTVNTPASDILITGDVLTVTLSFPYAVTVTGAPYLTLTVGSTTRNAAYTSGTGSKTLNFSYTIVAADDDTDGVALTGISLNGGTLTFDNNGTTTDCSTTISTTTFTGVTVDNTAPTMSSFDFTTGTTASQFYNVGDTISFVVTYSEAVVVTGSPYIALTFTTPGASSTNAVYSSGSGTTSLVFSYTIPNDAADTNGYNAIGANIVLNGGTITDVATNTAPVALVSTATVITASALRPFDGRVPYVTNVSVPASATYESADNLDFTLTFDRAVTVTGIPQLSLTVGSTARTANYTSGSGTTALTFRYTTVPGDSDSNGIAVSSTVAANSGTIIGTAAPANSFFAFTGSIRNYDVSVPSTTGVIVSSVYPTATSISRNTDTTTTTWGALTDNTWIIGQQLLLTVQFNTTMFVSQTGGTPRIPITIGVTTRYATYLSGGDGQTALVFSYTIVAGDLDTDGTIGIADIDLNGGSITDDRNTNALLTTPSATITSTTVDGVRPTISNVTIANGTYSPLNPMSVVVTWSEAVSYSSTSVNIPMTIGVGTVNAAWLSGSNSTTITHRPTLTGLTDSDGVALLSPATGTATIKDYAGNTATDWSYTPAATPLVFVDTSAATISSITAPADGTYTAGQTIDFSITFTESVTCNVSAGYPNIPITVGGTTRNLVPTANGTGTTHTFRYTVVAADLDTNGIAMTSTLNATGAGYIYDAAHNPSTFGAPVIPSLVGIIVDGTAPTVSGRSGPVAGTYTSGDTLSITLTFSEAVNVTGSPMIRSTAQTGNIDFLYASGSGTTSIVFSYTVTASDFDFDGLSSVAAYSFNGGLIEDLQGVDATNFTFTSLSLSTVFLSYPGIDVWAANNYTNAAPGASITLTNSGVTSTTTCNTKTCRVFNGDDTMTFSAPLVAAQTAFVVLKTNSASSNMSLLSGVFDFVDDTGVFDVTMDGSLSIDGVVKVPVGLNFDTNLATNTVYILQMDFNSPPTLSADVIPTTFLGSIAEVIFISGALTGAEKTEIYNYLNTKY